MAVEPLIQNDHVEVTLDRERRIVRLTRTRNAFPSVAVMATVFDEVNRAFDRLGRSRWNLLIDSRRAPGRNDPAFERAFEPYRQRLASGFRRMAVLIRTRVATLQAQRYLSTDAAVLRVEMQPFNDEDEAIAFLSGP